MQADLQERQETSWQGRYHTGSANNAMYMSVAFTNLSQAMKKDPSAVTNLMTANINLTEQVALYANYLSTKEADSMALQTATRNLQG